MPAGIVSVTTVSAAAIFPVFFTVIVYTAFCPCVTVAGPTLLFAGPLRRLHSIQPDLPQLFLLYWLPYQYWSTCPLWWQ